MARHSPIPSKPLRSTWAASARKHAEGHRRATLEGHGAVGQVAVAGAKDRVMKRVSTAAVAAIDDPTLQGFVRVRAYAMILPEHLSSSRKGRLSIRPFGPVQDEESACSLALQPLLHLRVSLRTRAYPRGARHEAPQCAASGFQTETLPAPAVG